MRKWLVTATALILILGARAFGDYTATQGSGTTFRAFDATHGGSSLCAAASTQCAVVGLINSAGAEIGTSGAPVRTDPTGTTSQPATQSGTWTVQPGNTANTTPWLATINQGGTSATVGTYGSAPGAVGALNVNASVTNANANGQATMANSSPVTLASNQAYLSTTGGWTTKLLNGLTTTVISIKAAAGQVGKVYCYNPNATVAYIQLFNTASGSVTLGTTSPTVSLGIPATNSSGFTLSVAGDQFGTAISAAATTTVAGSSAPSSAMDCNVSYN